MIWTVSSWTAGRFAQICFFGYFIPIRPGNVSLLSAPMEARINGHIKVDVHVFNVLYHW